MGPQQSKFSLSVSICVHLRLKTLNVACSLVTPKRKIGTTDFTDFEEIRAKLILTQKVTANSAS